MPDGDCMFNFQIKSVILTDDELNLVKFTEIDLAELVGQCPSMSNNITRVSNTRIHVSRAD